MQGEPKSRRAIAMLAGGYLCFGLAWILASDALLGLLLRPEQMQRLSTVKGVLFVLLTTGFWAWAAHHIGTLTPENSGGRAARAWRRPGWPCWPRCCCRCWRCCCACSWPRWPRGGRCSCFSCCRSCWPRCCGLTAGLATTLSGLLTALLTPRAALVAVRLERAGQFSRALMLTTGVVIKPAQRGAAARPAARAPPPPADRRRHRRQPGRHLRDLQGQVLLANQVVQQQQGVLRPLSPLEQATLGDGHVHNVAATRRLRDGPLHHLLLTVGPVPDAQGGRQGVFSIARDVTELRDSLAVLSRSQLALAGAAAGAYGQAGRSSCPRASRRPAPSCAACSARLEGQLLHSLSELARCFEPSEEFEAALERALAIGEPYQGDLQPGARTAAAPG
ncbi:MAG: PAS domain-containing protein [Inhella sp.]